MTWGELVKYKEKMAVGLVNYKNGHNLRRTDYFSKILKSTFSYLCIVIS